MEDYDYTPAPQWQGHDFDNARQHYDSHVGRSYSDAKAIDKSNTDLIPDNLTTQSSAVVNIMIDHTGSMGGWTKDIKTTIYSKMPYLEAEAQEYFGNDLVMSFSFVGDAYCDDYPWQIRPFASGTELTQRLEELVHEGGGGGQEKETYELGCLYYARKVHMPNVIEKPILIIVGDEAPYHSVNENQARTLLGIDLRKPLSTAELFEELKEKYAVYLIRKPYTPIPGDSMSVSDKQIYKVWSRLIGEDHIAILPEAERVVDVIFGLFAQETDRVDYFKDEIEHRQIDDDRKVSTTYKALKTVHALPAAGGHSGKSITKIQPGKQAKRLL